MNNKISEIKKTHQKESQADWMKQRIESASWRTKQKKTPRMCKQRKRLRKNEEGLREMQDNMKHNNIRIIGIPEGEE